MSTHEHARGGSTHQTAMSQSATDIASYILPILPSTYCMLAHTYCIFERILPHIANIASYILYIASSILHISTNIVSDILPILPIIYIACWPVHIAYFYQYCLRLHIANIVWYMLYIASCTLHISTNIVSYILPILPHTYRMLPHTCCIFAPILPHIAYCRPCLVNVAYCFMYIAYFDRLPHMCCQYCPIYITCCLIYNCISLTILHIAYGTMYCICLPTLPHLAYCRYCLVYVAYCLMYIAYFDRYCLTHTANIARYALHHVASHTSHILTGIATYSILPI